MSVLVRSKLRESSVVLFLWPNHPKDEFNSVRDHKELHDGSGPGKISNTVFLEIKNVKCPSNLGGIITILNNALDQIEVAMSKAEIAGGDDILVAVFSPKGCRVENSLCMLLVNGYRTIYPITTFKELYCGDY